MSEYPIANPAAARTLGRALRRIGYSEDALEALSEDDDANEGEDATVADRRLPQTHLGIALRSFYFQLPVARKDAVRALGRDAVEAAEAIGLVDPGTRFAPRARIMPVDSLLIASDDFPGAESDPPPDYVAAYTPTSRICDSLTPRRRVERALDVGTGSGVLGLLSALHARHVVATDVNARALAFGELNAALNGLTNIDFSHGSLFEPVEGELFDLITCNAPYVVSPENRWAYRDSGLQGDEISRRVMLAAADHLAEGGFVTMLASWLGGSEETADERPVAWAKALTDCDVWILSVWEADPLDHAATWNQQLAGKREQFADGLDRWTGYLAELGVGWVSEGAILLHRRPGRRHGARVGGLDDESLEAAGEQVRRAFAG